MGLEDIRRRMIADPLLYPEFGGSRASSESPTVISISSTSSAPSSSSGSSVAPKQQLKGRRAIVISSDEEDELGDDDDYDDDGESKISQTEFVVPGQPLHVKENVPSRDGIENSNPVKSQLPPFKTSSKPLANNDLDSRPQVPFVKPVQQATLQHPQFPGLNIGAKPIHIPSNRDLQFLPTRRQDDDDALEETIAVPDFREDNQFMTPADAEKALRDLMGGGINEDASTEINMEDAVVKGFRDDIRLLPHQILGRSWMRDREDVTKKRSGGILADDMGLGKTIQTLTRIVEGRPHKSDKEDGWDAPTLVICPLALVGQWADEVQKMAVGLKVIQHHGTSRTTDPNQLRRAHVVVTTYDVVKSEHLSFSPPAKDESKPKPKSKKKTTSSEDEDSEAEHFGRTVKSKKPAAKKAVKKDALFHLKWWRVVLDEAHNIKNQTTKGALACCDLQAKFRWCLTGTPMQNNVVELYSLIKFLRIKPLSNWTTFNEQIAKPVKSGRGANRAMKRLQVVLKQIMLRRRKDQTLNGKALIELPLRTVEIVPCPFNMSERTFYDALANKMESIIEKLMAQDGKANYTSVLLLLLRLRQACNHPILVAKDYKADMEAVEPKAIKGADDKDEDGDDLAAAFGQLGVARKCQVCQTELNSDNTAEGDLDKHCIDCAPLAMQAKLQEDGCPDSAKIRMILKLLADIDERSGEEEKTIIFSQFTSMLDLIEPFLTKKGIRFVRYDGTMSKPQREASLEKIKTSKRTRCILISFKAGSTGLNLTACNNVILVDLWWNPALEDQAFDRAHRYGQTRDVNIFKLKIEDTVEDRILELQEKKRELSKAALSGDKIKDMRLGMDDLLALFRPGGRDDDEED